MLDGEAHLHCERSIGSGIAQRRESLGRGRMISVQPNLVIRVPRGRLASDDQEAERINPEGEGENPPNPEQDTDQCLPQEPAHTAGG
jgi:hypothetical protein